MHKCSGANMTLWNSMYGSKIKKLRINSSKLNDGKLTIIGSDNGLAPGKVPSHYLILYWNIVDYILENKLRWYFNRHSNIIIKENAFENVVWKKRWPFCLGLNVLRLLRVWSLSYSKRLVQAYLSMSHITGTDSSTYRGQIWKQGESTNTVCCLK